MFEFEVSSRDISAIRRVFERDGVQSAAIELRRRVPSLVARLTGEGLTPSDIARKTLFFTRAIVARGGRVSRAHPRLAQRAGDD